MSDIALWVFWWIGTVALGAAAGFAAADFPKSKAKWYFAAGLAVWVSPVFVQVFFKIALS